MEIEVPSQELAQLMESFPRILKEPSERSAIIILGSRIETLTERACDHQLPGVQLSNQRRRIEALRGLGVIDDRVYELLSLFAKIRNYYAHSYDNCTLNDVKIKDEVDKFLHVGNALFNSRKAVSSLEQKLSGQLKAQGGNTVPGWFSTKINEIHLISTVALAFYLLGLIYMHRPLPQKLDASNFSIKTPPRAG